MLLGGRESKKFLRSRNVDRGRHNFLVASFCLGRPERAHLPIPLVSLLAGRCDHQKNGVIGEGPEGSGCAESRLLPAKRAALHCGGNIVNKAWSGPQHLASRENFVPLEHAWGRRGKGGGLRRFGAAPANFPPERAPPSLRFSAFSRGLRGFFPAFHSSKPPFWHVTPKRRPIATIAPRGGDRHRSARREARYWERGGRFIGGEASSPG